jgi:hypothetical protein
MNPITGHRILRRNGDVHANVVRRQVPLQNLALALSSQIVEHLAESLPDLAIKRLPAVLRYPDYVVLAVPDAVT